MRAVSLVEHFLREWRQTRGMALLKRQGRDTGKPYLCGVSVSPVRDCSVSPTTDEWSGPAKPRSDQPMPRIERGPSQARHHSSR